MKVSIGLFWLSYLCYETRNIYMVCENLTYHEFYEMSGFFKSIELFGTAFLLLQHWHLTSHYMKTSCLLRLAFSQHSAQALIKAQKRSSRLRYVDYSFYAFVLIILVLAVFIQSILYILMYVLWFFSILAIAFINCFSMRRISNELL